MRQKARFPELRPIFNALLFIVTLLLLLTMSLPRVGNGIHHAEANGLLQTAHGLAAAMFQYALDNNGNFPDGTSSTEAFQKLIPTYLPNRDSLFIDLSGKTKPSDDAPLKPENVGFDVTGGVNNSTPDNLPLVFTTGYKMSYAGGGSAVPLTKSPPIYRDHPLTWWERWNQPGIRGDEAIGLAVGFKDMSSAFFQFDPPDAQHPNGSVSNIIRDPFDPHGQTYRQLTPDGTLSGN